MVVDFLRSRLTDPRSRASDSNTETFDGNGSTTSFSLSVPSGSLSYVSSVSVDGSAQDKWGDYGIDLQNEKIIFDSAPGTGSDNVSVTYYYGSTNWIYPDIPFITTSRTSYPRISVSLVTSTGERVGNYQSDVTSTEHLQASIWAKEGYTATIDGTTYSNDKLALYFARKINLIFKDYIDDLYPKLKNYSHLATTSAGWDSERQVWQVIFEFELTGENIGE